MPMRPYLDPIDDQDAGNTIAQALDGVVTQDIPPDLIDIIDKRVRVRVKRVRHESLQDAADAFLQERADVKWKFTIEYTVEADEIYEADANLILSDMRSYGTVIITDVEEITG